MSLFVASNALILDCTYSVTSSWILPNLYTCAARVIFIGDPYFVTDVSTNHLANMNNSDVKGIQILSQSVDFIPFGFVNFFPNLESVNMQFSTVKTVSKESFDSLRELKELIMNNNQVQVVESNLFDGNPLMIAISFTTNPVRHVGHGVFDNLKYLTHIHFGSTTCINDSGSTRASAEMLMFRIFVSCPPTLQMTENRLIEGGQFQNQTEQLITDSLNPLKVTLIVLLEEVQMLRDEVQLHKEEVQLLRRRVEMLEGGGS